MLCLVLDWEVKKEQEKKQGNDEKEQGDRGDKGIGKRGRQQRVRTGGERERKRV